MTDFSPSKARSLGVGAICGAASGLLGVGGAVLMVPLLVHFVGLTQHRSHGTSLVVTFFTASAALVGYARGGHVDVVLALTLAAGSVFGAPLGARLAHRTSPVALRRAFGVLLFLVGIRLLLVQLPEGQLIPTQGVAGIAVHVAMGLLVGTMSGFFGVGGGVVLVPMLVLLSGLPQHLAQGVSLLFILPTAVVGGFTHYRLGNVDARLILPVALASATAALLASLVAAALPSTALRLLFGLLLVIVGLRNAWQPPARKKTSRDSSAK